MRSPMPGGRSSSAGAVLAFGAFLLLVGVLYLSVSLSARSPEISELSARTAAPGEVLSIKGRHFGDERGSGRVRIAGRHPATSSYISWSDTEIRLRVPEDVRSGLVYVETDQGESGGRLFTNRLHLPEQTEGLVERPGVPRIETVSPSDAAVGETITIRGTNFGNRRGNSVVLFLPGTLEQPIDRAALTLAALDRDPVLAEWGDAATPSVKLGEYQRWENRSLTVTVPDGARSGTLAVATDRGLSNPITFTVLQPAGGKRYHDRRSFALRQELVIEHITTNPRGFGTELNTLQIWLPYLPQTPEQRNHQTLRRNAAPLFRSPEGFEQFEFRNLGPRDRIELVHVQMIERYAVESRIAAGSVPSSYPGGSELVRRYTAADPFVPSDDDTLRRRAAGAVGNQRNPYRKAEQLFALVRNVLAPDEAGNDWNAREAYERGAGDAFDYAALYTALLRAVNVPARIVSGYLVAPDLNGITHHWVEFYLPSIGWIPADPALGDDLHAETFTERAAGVDNPGTYYFGNIDSRRVAFSTGMVPIPSLHPDAREREPSYRYSLQSRYEELSGSLSGYTSRWKPVRFLGEY